MLFSYGFRPECELFWYEAHYYTMLCVVFGFHIWACSVLTLFTTYPALKFSDYHSPFFDDLNFCTNWWWLGLRISVHLFGFLSRSLSSCVARHDKLRLVFCANRGQFNFSSNLILISPVLTHVLCRVSILMDTLLTTNHNDTISWLLDAK